MKKLSLVLLIMLLASTSVFAEWRLTTSKSNVYYISTKNINIDEQNYFNTLSGSISDEGLLTIKINLESIETNVPIRNERVKSMLFEVIYYTKATVTANVDIQKLEMLPILKSYTKTVDFTLDLHGFTQALQTEVTIKKLANGRITVIPTKPIMITAETFGLTKGIEKLRKIAGLKSITPTVPVTFNLTFLPR